MLSGHPQPSRKLLQSLLCTHLDVQASTLSQVLKTVIGQLAETPETLSISVRGLSARLLLAVWGNGDSRIQYVCSAGKRQLLQLCTRALSTDTLEGTFADMNSSLGSKATS
ncbi:MAG: hypothetical protein FRX49_11304 [Trebouxia sp. A1-2]|nr:MAG: hypothetical protein FRX49_11304 [Trebouxia sp. A1-2]